MADRSSQLPARYWAVIAAAGRGARMHADQPKQYLKLQGSSLLEHSLKLFLQAAWVEGIVTVIPPGDSEFTRLEVSRQRRLHTATGGATRAESVLAGLRRVGELAGSVAAPLYVLVHDAARPCVMLADVERLRDEATGEHGGLLAVPVSDTIKRAESQCVAATVDRRELWRAQTPQLFRLDVLRKALEDCLAQGVDVTDEARAMESAGFRPRLVEGRDSNIKVTTSGDLALAEFWLAQQERKK